MANVTGITGSATNVSYHQPMGNNHSAGGHHWQHGQISVELGLKWGSMAAEMHFFRFAKKSPVLLFAKKSRNGGCRIHLLKSAK